MADIEQVSEKSYLYSDSSITELRYKDLVIQVISECKEENIKPEEALTGYPSCKKQRIVFIKNNIKKYIDIPIELVECELVGGRKIKMADAIVRAIDIYKGPKGEFIGFNGEGSCGMCPSFWAFYNFSGDLLSQNYSRINDAGENQSVISKGSLLETFEQYGIDISKESLSDFIVFSSDVILLNRKEDDSSVNCLSGQEIDLPINPESLKIENAGFLNQEISCEQSIIEQIGFPDEYYLIRSGSDRYTLALFIFEGDNQTGFLTSIEGDKIISKLTIYRKWVDYTSTPNDIQNTTFKISKDYIIDIITSHSEGEKLLSQEKQSYRIDENGNFIEID